MRLILAKGTDLAALQSQIQVFSILRVIFVALAVLFLALTVYLVYRFRIWTIIRQQSGAEQRQSIRSQQQLNANTGRLQHSNMEKIAAQEFEVGNTGERKRRGRSGKTGSFSQDAGVGETSALGSNETTALGADSAAAAAAANTRERAPESRHAATGFNFVITMEQKVVHTDERIPEV